MKFIQLLSTIAALAIFATAPGVSAAGLRAGVDKTEEASGRRNLQGMGMIYGLPSQVPGMPGMYGPRGVPQGVPVNFNNNNEAQYYNGLYNNPGRAHAHAYNNYNNYNNYGEGYGGGPGWGYAYGGAPSRGHGGDAEAYCSKFTTRQACHAHDHDQCGWDDSRGCHRY